MDYLSGCVGKRRSRLRRYFQSLDVINYYSSRCLAEMNRYPTPLRFLFPRISAGLGLGARAFPCTRGYATANNISLLCCVQKLYDIVVFQKRLLCHRKKNQKYQLVHVMSACVIFSLVVMSSSKAIEDSRLRPGRTNVFLRYTNGETHKR